MHRVKPIAPVVELALCYKNILPMAVASGGEGDSVLATLSAIGRDNFFDTVLTTADAVTPKPDLDIFLEAARRMQIEPKNCLALEDGDAGIQAALEGGMHVIGVRPIIIEQISKGE